MCNKNFEIIRGKFKLPLLRGFIDDRITKHSTIERILSSDVDHWLANLYIDVIFFYTELNEHILSI